MEQLFKRVRLEVNNATGGKQTPWESSSLTNDFYFFGDTAIAATRAPDSGPVIQMASNFPSRRCVKPMITSCRKVRPSTMRNSSGCIR